ncbi:hypothetical protein DJ83_05590 [Halorubrum ezzemoulense]|uniref:Uncharacterized protein n=1 Tax=Halorubrum ezzemoulense TaxID=337243 RepID=A0A256J0M4_HALEZ|nr:MULTISPECIES: hypothetical protein [Halorubrum]MDB2237291.1 hypothetical protein [Halorubrum ezzemoulense]MDB2241769.1 hypothetical protein [Halorubrum ezzemoulense]MDB2246759.1 hypothetical protein [Halorubrum ezzemoulense]MDB2262671.1 hypothetical protein [Halorubrum ezzemoulense]MDB9300790.1 hypothetical protein [Halorubrum ezzemoulense]
MRSELVRAVRGVLAAVSLLAFVALFLAVEARVTSATVLGGLAAVAVAALFAAAGRSGIRRLLGRGDSGPRGTAERTAEGDAWLDEPVDDTAWTDRSDRAGDDPETDRPLARLEPALDDAWNRWSDAALTLGLAALGVGALVLLATYPGDDPPLGLLLLVAFGINGALVTLPFVFK